MTTSVVFSPQTFSIGTTSSGVIPIPSTVTKVIFHVTRSGWVGTDPTEILKLSIDLSLDGGTNWRNNWASFGMADDSGINSVTGLSYTESTATFAIPSPCQVRAHLTATKSITISNISVDII